MGEGRTKWATFGGGKGRLGCVVRGSLSPATGDAFLPAASPGVVSGERKRAREMRLERERQRRG